MINWHCSGPRAARYSKLPPEIAMPFEPQVRVFPSTNDLCRGAAEAFCRIGSQAIREHGRFTVALSGVSTHRRMHEEIVANFSSQLPWEKVFFFWGDERHVPPDFPESNYRMAKETLLSKLPIPHDHFFGMPGEMPDANQAAGVYEQYLREFFRPAPGKFPRFDFILLGGGPEGDTASLFPGTPAMEERHEFVVGDWAPGHSTRRITCTYPVLNNAANVLFLSDGSGKAEIVQKAIKDPAANLPCQGVRPVNGNLMWYLDQAVGARL